MRLRRIVRSILIVVVIATASARAPVASPPVAPPTGGDAATFSAIVERVKGGEPYYRAQGAELRARSYPTAHVFNWRTPLLLNSLATAPRVARGLIISLGLALSVLTIWLLRPALAAACSGVLQAGNLVILIIPPAIFMGEVWAGALIALSLCAYLRAAWLIGALLGGLALFVRELAAPYCVVCAIASFRQRRWSEFALWLTLGTFYTAYFLQHTHTVWAHQTQSDLAHPQPWLQFGGFTFILSLVASHVWLLGTPKAVHVAALSLIVLGTTSSRAPTHVRLASATYLTGFAFIGQDFNTYWAYLVWPTWAMASGYGFLELVDCARQRNHSTDGAQLGR